MLIDGHGYDSRSRVPEGSRRSKVSRILHPNGFARLEKEAGEKIESVLHARHDDYLVGGTIHTARGTQVSGYGFAQRSMSAYVVAG
jgi:hypothetical protein